MKKGRSPVIAQPFLCVSVAADGGQLATLFFWNMTRSGGGAVVPSGVPGWRSSARIAFFRTHPPIFGGAGVRLGFSCDEAVSCAGQQSSILAGDAALLLWLYSDLLHVKVVCSNRGSDRLDQLVCVWRKQTVVELDIGGLPPTPA